MPILTRLASALGRRDEVPNQELARAIAQSGDVDAITELVGHLDDPSRDVRYDCIKVLYEIGAVRPDLIADHAGAFLLHLRSKDNRMQWGAMTALAALTGERPGLVLPYLPEILDAADQGSVITKDQAMNILIQLCAVETLADQAFPLLLEQLAKAAPNQLPMYAENAAPVVGAKDRALFIETLRARLADVEKDSKKQRIEKVIRKVGKV